MSSGGEAAGRLDGLLSAVTAALLVVAGGMVVAGLVGPGPDGPSSRIVPAAAPLVTLGGAVGVSLGFGSSCTLQAVALSSETTGLVLMGPPAGTDPEDVVVGDLQAPEGISSIDGVVPEGDSVVARVTVPDPGGPLEVLGRLGLPGTEFC